MSEPDGAFLKLRVSKVDLIRWLESAPPNPNLWTDWRAIGGQWYFDDGVGDIARITDAELREKIGEGASRIGRYKTSRRALRDLVDYAEVPTLKHVSYDPRTQDFVAGTATYSENLIDFLVFLTVARGAAAYLGPQGYGIAAIHNYLWGTQEERVTQAALRLGPIGLSEFMGRGEGISAAGAFQAMADQMTWDPKTSSPAVDELDTLF